ncbi:MAG: GNAT family N-acetyltransferase [Chloroflexota bacterium]
MIQNFLLENNPSLRPLFDVPHLSFVIDAMQAGNSPATLWVDDPQNPRSAFIWDTTHSLYLGGDTGNTAFVADLQKLLAETILPHGREHHFRIFKIYTAQDAWAVLVPDLFQAQNMPTRERSLFQLDPNNAQAQPANNLPGFRVERISRELLTEQTHPNADRVLEEIMSCWTALDNFWARGFGFCALADSDEIAGWCTAEYVSHQVCGVGIETVEAYQGQGVATLVANAFAQHCRADGWTAHWDSWASNFPSVNVAQKAGFRKVSDYSVQIYVFEK